MVFKSGLNTTCNTWDLKSTQEGYGDVLLKVLADYEKLRFLQISANYWEANLNLVFSFLQLICLVSGGAHMELKKSVNLIIMKIIWPASQLFRSHRIFSDGFEKTRKLITFRISQLNCISGSWIVRNVDTRWVEPNQPPLCPSHELSPGLIDESRVKLSDSIHAY